VAYKKKEDQAAASKRHYEANKETYLKRIKKRNKSQRKINKEYVQQIKENSKCVDCGETNSLLLDFDHVRGEKKMCISNMAHQAYSLESIKEEMTKCETRCSNCHRLATYKRRDEQKYSKGVK